MTGEPQEQTEDWAREHNVEFPYAYLSKQQIGVFMKKLGMPGYPSAALVNPKGKVVWSGSPYQINGSLISKNLAGASKTPVNVNAVAKNWPEGASAVKNALKKGALSKALAAARKLAEGQQAGNQVVEDVQRLISRKATRARSKHEKGDYLGFVTAAKELKKPLSGLPEGKELDALVKTVKSDKAAKSVMTAQKKLQKIKASFTDIKKRKDLDETVKQIEKIGGKQEGTFAALTAQKMVAKLTKLRERLKR